MPITKDAAFDQLNALVKIKGALKIITNEVRPDLRMDSKNAASPIDLTHVRESNPDDASLQSDPALILKRTSTFVLQDVTELEVRDDGRVIARSADGSWTLGYPDALLARLTEHAK